MLIRWGSFSLCKIKCLFKVWGFEVESELNEIHSKSLQQCLYHKTALKIEEELSSYYSTKCEYKYLVSASFDPNSEWFREGC